jgi:hypothetical protein
LQETVVAQEAFVAVDAAEALVVSVEDSVVDLTEVEDSEEGSDQSVEVLEETEGTSEEALGVVIEEIFEVEIGEISGVVTEEDSEVVTGEMREVDSVEDEVVKEGNQWTKMCLLPISTKKLEMDSSFL